VSYSSQVWTGCFGIKIWADTTKFTNVRIAGFGQYGYLVIESEMFVHETWVASRVGIAERTVLYLG